MKINASIIKEKRQSYSWTQQHLADACDLSLRTIQRVETSGIASPETILGLAAVLNIEQQNLLLEEKPQRSTIAHLAFGVAILLAFIGGILIGKLVI